jgi:histidine phosphotransferase ChpT
MIQIPLSDFVSSRICHDLVSPIGAIGNGLELMEMIGKHKGPEFELVQQSVAAAQARLRFFRLAYGAASNDQAIKLGEANDIARAALPATLDITLTGQRVISRHQIKLAYLALQCAMQALPSGGQISAEITDRHIVLTATGQDMLIMHELWQGLMQDVWTAEASATHVQFILLQSELHAAGIIPSLKIRDDMIGINISG